MQPARRRQLKFDLPAAATADEEKTQTCSQPVTTPEAESDASTADVLQRQRSDLQQTSAAEVHPLQRSELQQLLEERAG